MAGLELDCISQRMLISEAERALFELGKRLEGGLKDIEQFRTYFPTHCANQAVLIVPQTAMLGHQNTAMRQ